MSSDAKKHIWDSSSSIRKELLMLKSILGTAAAAAAATAKSCLMSVLRC